MRERLAQRGRYPVRIDMIAAPDAVDEEYGICTVVQDTERNGVLVLVARFNLH